MSSLSSHLDIQSQCGNPDRTARLAAESAADRCLFDTVLLGWDRYLARSRPADVASTPGCSNRRGALLEISHSHFLRSFGSALDAACHTVDCVRTIRVCFPPSTSAASRVCHWTPLASVEVDIAVCVLRLRCRTFVARAVAKGRGICCRIEDVDLENVSATRLDEDSLQTMSVGS